MAHFAELDGTNTVLRVIAMSNDWVDANGGDFSDAAANRVGKMLKTENKTWKQTSDNSRFGVYHTQAEDGTHSPGPDQSKLRRHTFAGIGATYDPVNDIFIEAKPYPSWVLGADFNWTAPNHPGLTYKGPDPTGDPAFFKEWDEDNLRWVGKSVPDDTTVPPTPIKDWVWNTSTNVWDEVIS